jgi:hypothetical protein
VFPFSPTRAIAVASWKKYLEKLGYMHNNLVKRELVAAPGEWPWSSWRFYYLNDGSVLEMDRLGLTQGHGEKGLTDADLKRKVRASPTNFIEMWESSLHQGPLKTP